MNQGLKLSELNSMSNEQRGQALGCLLKGACDPTDQELQQQLGDIQTEIDRYERKYRIVSADLRQKLLSGEIQESADICSWLMLLKLMA